METLRRLLKDRSELQILGKQVSVASMQPYRDLIQTGLNGRKLETIGKVSSCFLSVVLPCLESIQEDILAIQKFKTIHDANVTNSKSLLLAMSSLGCLCSPFQLTKDEQTEINQRMSSEIGIGTYLLLCGSKQHRDIARLSLNTINKTFDMLDALEVHGQIIADIQNHQTQRAFGNTDFQLTRYSIEPIYGRQSDSSQIRTLLALLGSLQYCDPIGAPLDFWYSHGQIFETSLFQELDVTQLERLGAEIQLAYTSNRNFKIFLSRTSKDHLGECYNGYVSATIDRIYALTALVSATRYLAECTSNFTDLQFKLFAELFLTKNTKASTHEDYVLIRDELGMIEKRLIP